MGVIPAISIGAWLPGPKTSPKAAKPSDNCSMIPVLRPTYPHPRALPLPSSTSQGPHAVGWEKPCLYRPGRVSPCIESLAFS